MATPLAEATLNERMLPQQIHNEYEVTRQTSHSSAEDSDPPSSPFQILGDSTERENQSPSRLSRLTSKSPVDREPTSPLKMLKSRTSPNVNMAQSVATPMRSPRKLSSPEKRFPVKPSSPEKRQVVEQKEETMTIQDVLRDNEGLTKAMQILEDSDSDDQNEQEDTICTMAGSRHDETRNMDDTMVSTFSEFSAVPDMTMFAKIGHSPTKYASMGPTPRRNGMTTPTTSRRQMNNGSPSPTPRGHRYGRSREEGNTTNLILDFTEQINGFSGRAINSPTKQARQPIKGSSTMPDMGRYNTVTPSSNRMSNLLDFDIPPAPTPRSMPSITPRELESLKSGFLSEISSLRASLSGKDAEVLSLKTAVGDAEKRVGESMEQVREERNMKDQLAAEKEEWEKRGREMEAVLRNVKEEIVHGERERDHLEAQLKEEEKRREASEIMAQEAQSKLAAMRSNKSPSSPESDDAKSGECACGGRAVEVAVEKVSRELHTLYREKHETKVAKLKKSYEHRWEKKIRELENQIEDLTGENEMLKRDTTMTKVNPKSQLEATEDLEKQAAKEARAKELEAELEGLSETVRSVKKDNDDLRKLLEMEIIEKGNLVDYVDEVMPLMASMEEEVARLRSESEMPTPKRAHAVQSQMSGLDNLRGSLSRASGLRAPGTNGASAESRIGRGGFGAPAGSSNLERTRSGSSQGSRPASGLGYRSGIMGSIEKMGSYKGRGEKTLDG